MIKRAVEVAGRAPFRERGKRASARQTRGSRFAAERRNPNSANHGQAIRADQGFSRQKAAKNRRAAATDNAVLAYSVAATLRQPRSYQSVVTGAHCNKPAPARNPQLPVRGLLYSVNCNKPAPARNPQPVRGSSFPSRDCNKPAPARNPQRPRSRVKSPEYCNKPAPARNPQPFASRAIDCDHCNKPAPARNPQPHDRDDGIKLNCNKPAPARNPQPRHCRPRIRRIVINLRLPAIHNPCPTDPLQSPIITNPNMSAIYTQIDSDGCLF